jgi:hypothetical protein
MEKKKRKTIKGQMSKIPIPIPIQIQNPKNQSRARKDTNGEWSIENHCAAAD